MSSVSESSNIVAYWIANGFNPLAAYSFGGYTYKVFDYAISDFSEEEIKDFYYNNEVNFYEFLCGRSVKQLMTGANEYTFTFTVNYYRTKSENTDGDSWSQVNGLLDNAFNIVSAAIGGTWGGLVDFWRVQEDPAEIIEIDLAGEKVWKGSIQFFGTQTI